MLKGITWGWFFITVAGTGLFGQDQIRLKSGEVLNGTVMKYDDATTTLTFKFDKGTLGYTQADLAEVIMKERPGIPEGRKALAEGKTEEVIAAWKGPANEFVGINNPWVLECVGGLGQAYLAQGKVADAEVLYGKMKKSYPSGPAALRAEVGLAEATTGRDADGLLQKLKGLEGQIKEGLRPLREDREALAEYYFARGGAYEKKGDSKKALEDFLRVGVLYPEPPSLGKRAEKKAEALRQANKDLVTD